jgi:hypothetical protein
MKFMFLLPFNLLGFVKAFPLKDIKRQLPNNFSALATMTYQGTTGSGIFLNKQLVLCDALLVLL